jgi:hypothetical protein
VQPLYESILNEVEALVRACEEQHRPMEMDPARGELFELFVRAEKAGLTGEDAEPDLSADGLCKALAERSGLKAAARMSAEQQQNLSPADVARMRSLWSVLRMWMEWTYAWQRWPQFHSER